MGNQKQEFHNHNTTSTTSNEKSCNTTDHSSSNKVNSKEFRSSVSSANSTHSNGIDQHPFHTPFLWYPTLHSVKQIEYVRHLENEFACLQSAFLSLTTQFARVQFRIRQLVNARPCEREHLLYDLEQLAFNGIIDDDELPRIQRDMRCMGDVRRKQNYILEKLRNQLSALAEASELEGTEEETSEPMLPIPDDNMCYCMRRRSATHSSAVEAMNKSNTSRLCGVHCESENCRHRNGESCDCQRQSMAESSGSTRTSTTK